MSGGQGQVLGVVDIRNSCVRSASSAVVTQGSSNVEFLSSWLIKIACDNVFDERDPFSQDISRAHSWTRRQDSANPQIALPTAISTPAQRPSLKIIHPSHPNHATHPILSTSPVPIPTTPLLTSPPPPPQTAHTPPPPSTPPPPPSPPPPPQSSQSTPPPPAPY